MLLAEELVLLLLDDRTGRWLVRRRAAERAVRVALRVELVARQAVVLGEDWKVSPGASCATGGDPLLDRARAQIVGRRVTEFRGRPRRDLRAILRRLRHAGVLRRGWILRTRHLPVDTHPEAGVRAQVRAALVPNSRPDLTTALLIAVVHELGLIGPLFPGDPGLIIQADDITRQLRDERRYFPTTLSEDTWKEPDRVTVGDVVDAAAWAPNVVDMTAGAGRLVGGSISAALRAFDGAL